MGLKKLCRCNKIINYADKYCPECTVIAEREKSERSKVYDSKFRNKESTALYHSKQWEQLTEQCRQRFNGLDIYSYYVLGTIEYGSLSHHVIEINEDKSRAYDLDNLVYLSSGSHSHIHNIYLKSDKDKRDMQDLILNLVERWKKEFMLGVK